MSSPAIDFAKYAGQESSAQQIDFAKYESTPETKATDTRNLFQKFRDWLTSGDALKEAKASYEAKHGNVEIPGSFEGHPENVGEYMPAGPGEVIGGANDVLHGKIAKGGHRIISGAGNTMLPAVPFAAAAAPGATAAALIAGTAGSQITHAGAEALGATPDQSDFAGDLGGLIAGYAAGKIPMGEYVKKAILLGKTPEEAYQSALKPSGSLGPKKVASAVDTGLKEGIPVSKEGLEKLSDLIDQTNAKMDAAIPANTSATVNKFKVASRLNDTTSRFANQVNPEADIEAISKSGNEFLRNQPGEIPAQTAADIKSGTYRAVGSKAYGEVGTAAKAAQKDLARGIKEELISQFPELKDLGLRDQQFINLEGPLQSAVNRISNHQIVGMSGPIAAGATKAVTGSNKLAAAVGFLKAVLDDPGVKSRLAIAISRRGVPLPTAIQRVNSYSGQLAAAALRSADGSDENPGDTPAQ